MQCMLVLQAVLGLEKLTWTGTCPGDLKRSIHVLDRQLSLL